MYERVQRHETGHPGRDKSLVPHIALVAVLAAALIIPFASMGAMMYRYQSFKQDLAASIAYGEKAGAIPGTSTRFFQMLVDAGMGKPQTSAPAWDPARCEFGDGSTLELWKVAIDGDSDKPGTFIRYTRPDGSVFSYDTDKIDFDAAVEALRLG